MATSKNTAAIFWHSDPVKPDETIVLSGDFFEPDAVMKLTRLPDKKGQKRKSVEIKPLQISTNSIKAPVPADWEQGIYECTVKQQAGESKSVLVNAPDIWWTQGDEGISKCRSNGWLRLLGKCLSFDRRSPEIFLENNGVKTKLEIVNSSCWSIEAKIPKDLTPGGYEILASNGFGKQFVNAGSVEILPIREDREYVLDVTEFGADPTGKKDSTMSVVMAMERLWGLGGGVVYFPRGRYRIDSGLRSGTFIKTPLQISPNTVLRGENKDLVSLWWPDQEPPLPSLIEGGNDFGIEDLSIYTQGPHSSIISGNSNVKIKRVCVRVNCYYMTCDNGRRSHHERKVDNPNPATGAVFHMWGNNISITECDIYTSGLCFDIKHCRGGNISGNLVRANNLHSFSGGSEMIFEKNDFSGNQLTSGGSNVALHFGAVTSEKIYYAENKISHIYGGDHEAFTLDGHATAYFGKVKNVSKTSFSLAGTLMADSKAKGAMKSIHGAIIYIIDGRGKGQYRSIIDNKDSKIVVDKAWCVEPDENSIISIGGFNGKHLFIANDISDTGTAFQLYPPNCECIVAENKMTRTSNINSLSKLGKNKESDFIRVEPSWYNQFIDNHVLVGNSWGGGTTQIDRWIGGESCLNIWGWQVYYYSIDGADFDEFMPPEVLREILGEKKCRKNSIALSNFQIVRRHQIDNNSSIRIKGAVADCLVEKCEIRESRHGVRISMQLDYEQPKDLGQLFDFDPVPSDENSLAFLSPQNVLVRDNIFEDVENPLDSLCQDKGNILLC